MLHDLAHDYMEDIPFGERSAREGGPGGPEVPKYLLVELQQYSKKRIKTLLHTPL